MGSGAVDIYRVSLGPSTRTTGLLLLRYGVVVCELGDGRGRGTPIRVGRRAFTFFGARGVERFGLDALADVGVEGGARVTGTRRVWAIDTWVLDPRGWRPSVRRDRGGEVASKRWW